MEIFGAFIDLRNHVTPCSAHTEGFMTPILRPYSEVLKLDVSSLTTLSKRQSVA